MNILPNSGRRFDGDVNDDDFRRSGNGEPAAAVQTPTSPFPGQQTGQLSPGPNNPEIAFTGSFFRSTEPKFRILSPSTSSDKTLTWESTNKLDPADVNWIAWIARSDLNSTNLATVDNVTASGEPALHEQQCLAMSKQQSTVTIHFLKWLNLAGGRSVVGRANNVPPTPQDHQPTATDVMMLQVSWTKSETGERGLSNSGVFFVKAPDQTILENMHFTENDTNGYDPANGSTGIGVGTSTTQAVSMPSAGGNSADTNGTPSSNNSGSASTGLSPGAIAGIAVGGAVALVLIAGLVWFVLRRRRKQEDQPSDAQYRVNSFLEDKGLAAAQVANSRRSGHSEDSTRVDNLTHGTNANPTRSPYQPEPFYPSNNQAGSLASFHDPVAAPHGIQNEHQRNASVDTEREYPPHPNITLPIPSRIRHLVEPQHTNADLRRLLEEEDLLDEEIARGG